MGPVLGILLFSLIETLTVVVWLALLKVEVPPHVNEVVAGAVLFVGYVVEHVVAFNVGKGRPLFSFPRA